MKERTEVLRKAMATIFANLMEITNQRGVQYKYENKATEKEVDGKKKKGWRFAIIVKELGYPERILQEWNFDWPEGLDRYSMEYNALMVAFMSFADTSLLMWDQLGKELNTDVKLQEVAKKV